MESSDDWDSAFDMSEINELIDRFREVVDRSRPGFDYLRLTNVERTALTRILQDLATWSTESNAILQLATSLFGEEVRAKPLDQQTAADLRRRVQHEETSSDYDFENGRLLEFEVNDLIKYFYWYRMRCVLDDKESTDQGCILASTLEALFRDN